jgi:hypothetical protein
MLTAYVLLFSLVGTHESPELMSVWTDPPVACDPLMSMPEEPPPPPLARCSATDGSRDPACAPDAPFGTPASPSFDGSQADPATVADEVSPTGFVAARIDGSSQLPRDGVRRRIDRPPRCV